MSQECLQRQRLRFHLYPPVCDIEFKLQINRSTGYCDFPKPPCESPAPSVDANVNVTTGKRHRVPPALLGIDAHGVALGVPAVEVRPVYSRAELAKYGVEQDTEIRFPVVRGAF